MSLEERLQYAAMKARHAKSLQPWSKKWWGRIILIILGLVFIGLLFSSFYIIVKVRQILTGQADTVLTAAQRQEYLVKINGDGTNYYLGTSTPQVTIVEFGDFACPYTEKSYAIINKIAAQYPSKVRIVWRDYLRNQDSIDLAVSARCAGEQGKFWAMHDALLSNQDKFNVADSDRPNRLAALAQTLQLNVSKFTTCLTDQKYLDQIKKDYDDGNKLQIIGTPTWFVNNYTFAGALTEDKFIDLITGLIK